MLFLAILSVTALVAWAVSLYFITRTPNIPVPTKPKHDDMPISDLLRAYIYRNFDTIIQPEEMQKLEDYVASLLIEKAKRQ